MGHDGFSPERQAPSEGEEKRCSQGQPRNHSHEGMGRRSQKKKRSREAPREARRKQRDQDSARHVEAFAVSASTSGGRCP